MRKTILFISMLFLSFMVIACDKDTIDEVCQNGYVYNEINEDCEIEDDIDDGQIHIPSNIIHLNMQNETDWETDFNDFSTPSFSVNNDVLSFKQKDASDTDSYWDRKITYNGLKFEDTKVYTISFTVYGSEDQGFYLEFISGNDESQIEFYTLNGKEQELTFRLINPKSTENEGKLNLGFGAFSENSNIIMYNFNITEESRGDAVINILFVGNSFTFYNDMPNTVEKMGLSNGYTGLNVEHVTFGGTTLEKFATPTTEESKAFVEKMNETKWDYVILQDHSSRPYTNPTSFHNSVRVLSDYIKERGSQIILYSTWAYRDGSLKLADTGLSYKDYYDVLTTEYSVAAKVNNIKIAHVGTAFYDLYISNPNINILRDDDFHPNNSGSYLAAYVFYTMIFGEDNKSFTPKDVSINNLNELREIALGVID